MFDPRLSTTYNGAGEPRRFGIELWLGEDEDGDLVGLSDAGLAQVQADLSLLLG